jgi:hypothetical protein
MTRYDWQWSEVRSDIGGLDHVIDALIRPCMHKAFPLPPADHVLDDRFRVLLDALSQRSSEPD